jgi:hypothetical protein
MVCQLILQFFCELKISFCRFLQIFADFADFRRFSQSRRCVAFLPLKNLRPHYRIKRHLVMIYSIYLFIVLCLCQKVFGEYQNNRVNECLEYMIEEANEILVLNKMPIAFNDEYFRQINNKIENLLECIPKPIRENIEYEPSRTHWIMLNKSHRRFQAPTSPTSVVSRFGFIDSAMHENIISQDDESIFYRFGDHSTHEKYQLILDWLNRAQKLRGTEKIFYCSVIATISELYKRLNSFKAKVIFYRLNYRHQQINTGFRSLFKIL